MTDRLFKEYYLAWGGEKFNLTSDELQLPGFFQRVSVSVGATDMLPSGSTRPRGNTTKVTRRSQVSSFAINNLDIPKEQYSWNAKIMNFWRTKNFK